MPYLGRSFHNNHFSTIPAVERFNGDGSTTAFTLSRAVGDENEILISVDGVMQDTTAYGVASTTLTFTTAPTTGFAYPKGVTSFVSVFHLVIQSDSKSEFKLSKMFVNLKRKTVLYANFTDS